MRIFIESRLGMIVLQYWGSSMVQAPGGWSPGARHSCARAAREGKRTGYLTWDERCTLQGGESECRER
jgi:hypothetical protein